DGYAVRSQLTFGASEAQPVTLEVPGQAEPINTGNPVPPDKDAVYKIEEVHQRADTIEMMTPTFPGQHVRLVGEEVTAGDLLVTAGEELQPRHIGRLLAAQVWTIPVRRKPTVAVIPTGAECLPIGQPPGKGQFVEYNGPMMAAALSQWGCVPQLHEPVPDEETALARAVSQATADSDIVLIIAGSSAGSRDFVPSIIARLGELLVHGVEMMPGKPLALGWIDNTPIIGLPGYSVAAWMCLQEFARPLITRRLGLAEYERPQVRARLQRKLPSTAGIEETLRVVMCDDGHQRTVVPLARGSGSIGSLAQAHGLLTIDQTREGLEAGTEVAVRLLVPRVRIERSIVAIGSHDLALAALAERLA
ncbi:MAG: molybdopterin biosynthesis protein, partial [Armatimonadetes bacterium]|nr:molybdopterin biosynthesis protein [Armatimonadota bacterium]